MNDEELVNALRYLITKYISKKDSNSILEYLKKDNIPVKGILSDIHIFKTKEIESIDGNLIKKIYYYYC